MTPEIVGTLILTVGGLILAMSAVMVSKNATRWPNIAARLAECEVAIQANARLAQEASEAAIKARRVVSRREAKKTPTQTAAIEAEVLPVATTRAGRQLASEWVAGATASGRPFESAETVPEDDPPTIVEFAD